jgi:hypothetical protein
VAQFVHGAGEAEPIEDFVVPPVLDFFDRGIAPQLPIAVFQRFVIALVRLDVREHQGVFLYQK